MIQTLDDDDRGERTRKKTVSFGSAQRVSREQLEKENRQIERPTTRKSLIELLLFFFRLRLAYSIATMSRARESERERREGREREIQRRREGKHYASLSAL